MHFKGWQRAALLLCALALLASTPAGADAQQNKIAVKVLPGSSGRVVVEGNSAPIKAWSFVDSYAGVLNLGSRVESFQLFDATGVEISSRKIAPGQFEAISPASKFRYEVSLAPQLRAADAAKVSWLKAEQGLLMLRDLLPVFSSSTPATKADLERVTMRLDLPAGWSAQVNQAEQRSSGEFEIADRDSAVIAVGKDLRFSRTTTSGMTLNLVAAGEWAFTDSEAMDLAAKILKAHYEVFRAAPFRTATLILFPLPPGGTPDQWSAETRGPSVTLLIGKLPSRVGALAQLSVPLTHELLHFWVPNGLTLVGEYDWFYEGFTVYQAARIGVRLDLLTFAEFLNAIGRAYDGYSLAVDHDRWSLVDASKRRWTVGGSSIYSKSMVVAFLYDLRLRSSSNRKHSLDDIYRNVFHEFGAVEPRAVARNEEREVDGNEAVLKALGAYSTMQDFGKSFISTAVGINLAEQLAPFGLRVETFGLRTRISVSNDLTRSQRDLLHDLGYNDQVHSPRQRKLS